MTEVALADVGTPAPSAFRAGADDSQPPTGGRRKLAASLARRIESDILAAGWPVGTVFGGEAELMERYGVSRAVLREAVRIVEHHTVATMRRGPSGGLVVRAPDADPAIAAMVLYLEYVGASVDDLLYVRGILEPLAASAAAERVEDDAVAGLHAALAAEAALDVIADGTASRDALHLALAAASGNPVLEILVNVLVRLTARYAMSPPRPPVAERERVADEVTHAHHAILQAVVAGESMLAAHRAATHLEAMRAWLVARPPHHRQEAGGVGTDDLLGSKLSEIVARRVLNDIVDRGWPLGEVLGSETELLARYKVSRAVLREAFRLLEHHSIAVTRRGPGGGLVVTAPDPTASIEATSLQFDYRRASADDLREVREALEVAVVERLITFRSAAAEVTRVHEALAVDAVTDPEQVNLRANAFHTQLAELTGNPVLALFLRLLTYHWVRHTDADQQPGPDAPHRAEASHAHEVIVAAVAAGDVGAARRRMLRHLRAITPWWE